MRRFASRDIVRVWEHGFFRNSVERSLALLAPVFPEMTRSQLTQCSIGNRDLRLLMVKEQLSGPQLRGVVRCPRCNVELGFSLRTTDIRRGDYRDPGPPLFNENLAGFELTFRLPNSADQLAMLKAGDPITASSILLRRIVKSALHDKKEIYPPQLPPEVLEKLGDRINDLDPQAEVRFSMDCAVCHHHWSALFEVSRFVWTEINDLARNLLTDVVQLARAFGWSEADILEMSPQRRDFYLERC